MSKELLIGQLRLGTNGNQILSILDTIVNSMDDSSSDSNSNELTAEYIEF